MATVLSILLGIAVFTLLAIYPATPRTNAGDLESASLTELAGSAELWLEGKRRALPNAAIDAIDMIGVRLEQIAPQLAMLEETGPAAREVRKRAQDVLKKLG